jgi:succinyl-CoA--D-citramalate CoA-transferase
MDAASPCGPLAGLKVLDAGNMIAGPMATVLLGDYGADVIKLEHPVLHDPLRDWAPKRDGISLWWKVLNRNKRVVTLDLSQRPGRDVFLRLVDWADVVVENFRPGTFERWGLGYPELSARKPGLVLVRVSGFGQTGPYARRPGYGTIAEAMSGIPFFTGPSDGPPTLPGFPMADAVAGVFSALAAVSGVWNRDCGGAGKGQEVDVSLYEPLFRLVDSQVIAFDQLGLVKERLGNRLAEDAPRNAYATADDRWIAISASSNRTWARLAGAIGQPALAEDARFSTTSGRLRNVEELDKILGDWFRSRACADAMRVLEEHDVVAGPVLNVAEIFADPQYQARDNVIEVDDPDFGHVRMQGVTPRFGRTPGAVRFTGAAPGAHNVEVFGDMLRLDAEHLAGLEREKVI